MALYGIKFEIAEMVFGGASRESGRLAHGHVKARTCKKDTEAFLELDASITYVGSLFDSDDIKEL